VTPGGSFWAIPYFDQKLHSRWGQMDDTGDRSRTKTCLQRIGSASSHLAFTQLSQYSWCIRILYLRASGTHCVATPLIFALCSVDPSLVHYPPLRLFIFHLPLYVHPKTSYFCSCLCGSVRSSLLTNTIQLPLYWFSCTP